MSKLNKIQRDRNSTSVTTFRGDIRTIATLASFWQSKGEALRSINDILKLSTEALKELIVNAKPEFEIATTTDAVEFLEGLGLLDIGGKFRNKTTLLKELSIEDLMSEGQGGITPQVTKRPGPFASLQEKEKVIEELEKRLKED